MHLLTMQQWHIRATADGSVTVENTAITEYYHSKYGALTESRSVFLENSLAAEKLQTQRHCRVLEVGFGSGLNFLLTAIHAVQCQASLSYTAIEYAPLPSTLLSSVLRQNFPDQHSLIGNLTDGLSQATGQYESRILVTDQITLTLQLGDATQTTWPLASFDAIYHDAFSNRVNPTLWQHNFLRQLRQSLASNGILSTFSVNRAFREELALAGFQWQKLKGPPGKRHVLRAW